MPTDLPSDLHIDTLLPVTTGRWIVCQSSGRWLPAVRQFAAALMPAPLVPIFVESNREQLVEQARGNQPCVVLLETDSQSLPKTCETLVQLARRCPAALPIVAEHTLSAEQRLTLVQFPLALLVRHPEHLQRLAPMIQGHFARMAETLD